MKTKQYSSIASKKMKSAILYPYGPLSGTGCCRMLNAKHLAITSAIYTLNISILIVLIYAWRISVNTKRYGDLEDVYYGVQIAYFAIIGTQMSMIVLSIMLMFGIYKENPGLIVPWIIGFITFMALEAVAMVYSNVLRDHVNKKFDSMCKAEVSFFITRAFVNVIAMWGVLRFYNLLRIGITWKGPEEKGCFLFDYDDDDDDDNDDDDDDYDVDDNIDEIDEELADDVSSSSSTIDYDYDDENLSNNDGQKLQQQQNKNKNPNNHQSNNNNNNNHSHNQNNNNSLLSAHTKRHKYKVVQHRPKLEVIDELEKSYGSGSDENDTLLVAYKSDSIASV